MHVADSLLNAHLADSFPLDFAQGCGSPGLWLTGYTPFRLVNSYSTLHRVRCHTGSGKLNLLVVIQQDVPAIFVLILFEYLGFFIEQGGGLARVSYWRFKADPYLERLFSSSFAGGCSVFPIEIFLRGPFCRFDG